MSLIPFGFWAASGAGGGAGAFDLLETTTLTSSASSVTFTGLGAYSDYKHLQIRMVSRATDAASADSLYINLNNDSGNNYSYHRLLGTGTGVASSAATSLPFAFLGIHPANSLAAGVFGAHVVDILDAFSSSKNSTIRSLGGVADSGFNAIGLYSGLWMNSNAVTQIGLTTSGTAFTIGSRFSLYGVK